MPDGVFCKVGIPEGSAHSSLSGNINALVFGQKKIVGSIVGGRLFTNEMVQLAGHHKVIPEATEMPFSQVNEAFAKLVAQDLPKSDGHVCYRIVLKW